MAQDYRLESILAADCGNVTTSAVLIDLVKGQYRFVARGEAFSTVSGPAADVYIGLRRAVRQVEQVSGRRLLSNRGYLLIPEQRDGSGVDTFVATTSAARPLNVVITGLTYDFSITRARRALESSHAVVSAVWRYKDSALGSDRLGDILHVHLPDVVLLTGGVDDGARGSLLQMTEMLAVALERYRDDALGHNSHCAPHVIYAGNPAVAEEVAAVLADKTAFHAVTNVSPVLEAELLTATREKVDELYQQYQIKRLPGYRKLKAHSLSPVLSTAQALGYIFKLLGQHYDLDVLGVDVGGATTDVISVLGQEFAASSNLDLGVGQQGGQTLALAGYEMIARWFPFAISSRDMHNRIWNKSLHPSTIPETSEDLWLEQAMAREALRLAIQRLRRQWGSATGQRVNGGSDVLPKLDLIVLRGHVLTRAPRYGQTVLVALDALQPVGVCDIVVDKFATLPQLGALATVSPLAAVQLLEREGMLKLATIVAPVGVAKKGDVALRAKVRYPDHKQLELEVKYGTIEVLPLPVGQTVTLEIYPSRRFDLGMGKGIGRAADVEGGAVGIVIDARGRPLTLPSDVQERRSLMREWLWNVGG